MPNRLKEPSKSKGQFITFEGGEGVGKTTQIDLLKSYLLSKDYNVISTREPGGTNEGETIRKSLVSGLKDTWDPISEALIFNALRRQHINKVIIPSLNENKIVLCDRFIDSTIVYQGFGKGVDRDLIEDLHLLTLGKIYPDLTFFLDIPAELGLKRSSHRDKKTETLDTRFENMNLAFHERLRNGFKTLSVNNPGRIISIDAKGSSKTVTTNIINILNNVFYSELSL